MIITNLMVADMARAIAFYRDVIGMTVKMTVSPDRETTFGASDGINAAFAILEWNGAELMLQTQRSLSDELPIFAGPTSPSPSCAIYFRGLHPDTVKDRLPQANIVKGPFLQWYGMREIYLCDPDGHIVCLTAPEGDPPV
jgi:catechol 2,3-dioxygenase-like lactoylglutathione lyase family enzyme